MRARSIIVCAPAIFVIASGASAQTAPVPSPGPSLQVTDARLSQIDADLRFRLRFNRAVPVRELRPPRGRAVCIVLSPKRASRRRVCVSRRAGRLTATIAPVSEAGEVAGPPRPVQHARIAVAGRVLTLRAAAEELRVRLGRRVSWHTFVRWRDGAGCRLEPDPAACTQVMPSQGELTLVTRALRRPSFAQRGRLRLLATGDSMIQIVDGYLQRRLDGHRGTTVRSDAHISTGISKPRLLNWSAKARGQAVSFKPDVTVMFLGANDGLGMETPSGSPAPCCGASWVKEYARRVEAMMRSYLRGGRSYVYWLTLPAPRRDDFARVYRRVNVAIRRAAAKVGRGVRVIDLVPVFTPGGRFRQTATFRGKTVNARQDDGIHLSPAGAAIASTLVIDRLRADRALP